MKKIVMVLPEDVRDNMEIQGQVVEVEASANTDTVKTVTVTDVVTSSGQAAGQLVNTVAGAVGAGANLAGVTAGTVVNLGFGIIGTGLRLVTDVLQAFSEGLQTGMNGPAKKA
jgi:hypothetical protein